jgi:hypothetical protein
MIPMIICEVNKSYWKDQHLGAVNKMSEIYKELEHSCAELQLGRSESNFFWKNPFNLILIKLKGLGKVLALACVLIL